MTKQEILKEMLSPGAYKARGEYYAKTLRKETIERAFYLYTTVSHSNGLTYLHASLSENENRLKKVKWIEEEKARLERERKRNEWLACNGIIF